MGFADRRECPHLCKLASDYIKKTEGCEENIYEFFANDPDADSLFIKLIEEFERCTLSYFAFHWRHAHTMIGQVVLKIYTCYTYNNYLQFIFIKTKKRIYKKKNKKNSSTLYLTYV